MATALAPPTPGQGKTSVVERGHTLLLNWSDESMQMIEEVFECAPSSRRRRRRRRDASSSSRAVICM